MRTFLLIVGGILQGCAVLLALLIPLGSALRWYAESTNADLGSRQFDWLFEDELLPLLVVRFPGVTNAKLAIGSLTFFVLSLPFAYIAHRIDKSEHADPLSTSPLPLEH